MGWLGKVIGGTIGFALGGPLGAVAGAAFGHGFDMQENKYLEEKNRHLSREEQAQMTFFVAAFSMLAKVAKVDGRICEREIASIEKFMTDDLMLDAGRKQVAINIFRTASHSHDTFESFARQFYHQFHTQPRFLEIMLDILLQVSLADGRFSSSEEELVLRAVNIFGYGTGDYLKLKSKYIKDTDKYHAILGCDRNDPDDFVKKQYRKLVSEYHPDKIASKGLPEEFTKFAEDKFKEIQEAYGIVKKERNMK